MRHHPPSPVKNLPVGSYAFVFFFNDTATTEIYTLSLHDALPISKTSSPQWSHLRPIQANSEGHLSPRGNEASDVLPEQHVPEYLKGQGPCSQSRILAVLAASGPAVRPSDATARSTDIRMMS